MKLDHIWNNIVILFKLKINQTLTTKIWNWNSNVSFLICKKYTSSIKCFRIWFTLNSATSWHFNRFKYQYKLIIRTIQTTHDAPNIWSRPGLSYNDLHKLVLFFNVIFFIIIYIFKFYNFIRSSKSFCKSYSAQLYTQVQKTTNDEENDVIKEGHKLLQFGNQFLRKTSTFRDFVLKLILITKFEEI